MFDIQEELKKLPGKPGVYIMHDKKDNIIYVGKAVSLKNRVRQYFQNSRNHTPKIQKMVSMVDYFEYIIVDSEMEALILECNLIKEYKPKYNTMLKDDKGYPYIKVTVAEDYPRIFLAHEKKKDHAKYFGPYTSVGAVNDSIELLKKTYGIRNCQRKIEEGEVSGQPCLYYHMKQCKAPCQGWISTAEYKESVDKALEFLGGKYGQITDTLKEKMLAASEAMEYEKAAEYRDLLNSILRMSEQQKATDSEIIDRDIIAFASAKDEAVAQVFFIRAGKMIGREHYYLTGVENSTREEIMTDFIKQYYSGTPYIPAELLISVEIPEAELIEQWLTAKSGRRVYVRAPKKGDKSHLVELAEKNASNILQKDSEKIAREEAKTVGAMAEIAGWLDLPKLKRVEAFDISNINGFENVGSMIVYEDGRPKKADYRKFKIKTIVGQDDYGSMREVLTRRFKHGMREKEEMRAKNVDESRIEEFGSFTRYPDLIMMDGGRGQVNIALEVLDALKLNIPVCGMVKDDNHRTRGLYFNNMEIPIDTHSEGFKLITRIQDETHRFAIEYHRSLRGKTQVHSILDDIPGIGPSRRRALMKHFRSIDEIKAASVEELAEVPSMNENAARQVYEFFRKFKD